MNNAFLQDLLFGFRLIRRNPYLSALAIFCLAAGIGLTTFMFSITYAVVARGLPYPEQDRIIHILRTQRADVADGRTLIHIDDFLQIQEQQTSFTDLSAFTSDLVTLGEPGFPHRMNGAYVSEDFFRVLPIEPLLGRTFKPEDFAPSASQVLILAHDPWQAHFAGDPGIIGREVICEGRPFTVVGVLPPGYDYPFTQDVWIPLVPETIRSLTGWIDFVSLIGRLKEGRSLREARAEYGLIFERIAKAKGETDPLVEGPSLEPFFYRFAGDEIRLLMWSMFAATFLVLLIACSNVSGLLTARMVARSNELAIRSALGADRKRIVAQILSETFLYGLLGTALGLFIAWRALDFLWRVLSQFRFSPPEFMRFQLDPVSIAVAVGLMLVAILTAGFLPAWRASRTNISTLLNDTQRTGSSQRMSRLNSLSTIMQLAFSFALLVAAGRMIASIVMMTALDYPFEEKGLLVGEIAVDNGSYPEPADQVVFWKEIHRSLEGIAAVKGISMGFNLPCVWSMQDPIRIEGKTYYDEEDYPQVRVDVVAPGYFETLGVDLIDGRDFDDGDVRGKESVAIINTVMADKFWPRQNPLGKVFYMEGKGDFTNPEDRRHRVIGIVPDLKMGGLINMDDDGAGFYRPQGQSLWGDQKIFLRTDENPGTLIPEVQRAITAIDPDVAFTNAMRFEEHVRDNFFYFRFFLWLFSAFGGMALLLAAAGVYGIIQYSVSQRSVEIGIRMALGATPGRIRLMVLWNGIRNGLYGLLFGVLISFGLTHVLSVAFTGVPEEWYSFAGALVVLMTVVLLANGFPARRASRLDPMIALRVQ